MEHKILIKNPDKFWDFEFSANSGMEEFLKFDQEQKLLSNNGYCFTSALQKNQRIKMNFKIIEDDDSYEKFFIGVHGELQSKNNKLFGETGNQLDLKYQKDNDKLHSKDQFELVGLFPSKTYKVGITYSVEICIQIKSFQNLK